MHRRVRSITLGMAEIWDEDPHLAPAVELADALGAVLHVVHAFPPLDPILDPLDATEASKLEGIQTLHDKVRARLEGQVGRPAQKATIVCHAVSGSPAEAILGVGEREGADLLIVGASRRGPVASSLLGTTAQRVLRAAAAPVLVNRRSGHGPPRRILFTTDLSEVSARVHERGVELVAMLWSSQHAEVRLLLVGGDEVLLPPAGHQIAMRAWAQARLEAFLERTPTGGRGVEARVRLGIAAREILAEAEDWDADLLVLGTRARTGISRFLIGSVAETVSRKAPCDVLLLPVAALGPMKGADERAS